MWVPCRGQSQGQSWMLEQLECSVREGKPLSVRKLQVGWETQTGGDSEL